MSLLVCSFVFVCLFPFSLSWINHLALDSNGNYQIWWSLMGESITFRVEVATKGWIALGVSPTEEICKSDFITAWSSDGNAIFHDRYGDDNGVLLIDSHQDWELLERSVNVTHTIIKLKRKLITCDKNDVAITDDTMKLIYAYGEDIPQHYEKIDYQQTTRRGMRSIFLLQQQLHLSNNDSLHWNIRTHNVEIEHNDKPMYICSVHKAPNLGRKHHIIGFHGVVQPGHESYVHHMVLSACLGVTDVEMEPYVNTSIPCLDESMSWKYKRCEKMVAIASVNIMEVVYPEHVGLPFGLSDPLYFVLDVHYNNVPNVPGWIDNSGLRIVYTPNLRQYDASVLLVGSAFSPCVVIPPHQKEFTVVGHASSSCLSLALPPTGIKVYSVTLHSHLTGRKLILRHFREGKELPPIAKDDNFDFYYQTIRNMKKDITVLPGDNLMMECVFDSSGRNITTVGGYSSTNEMCEAYIGYYPMTSSAMIQSSPTCSLIAGLTGASINSELPQWIISPVTGLNDSFIHYISTYKWSPLQIPSVQQATLYSPHSSICEFGNGTKIRVGTFSYPEIKQPYQSVPACSDGQDW